MLFNQDTRAYFEIGDRPDLTYEQKLAEYRRLADSYFQVREYEEFCAEHLGRFDDLVVEYFGGAAFDEFLAATVTSTFPAHEHESMLARYRGLVGAWVEDQG